MTIVIRYCHILIYLNIDVFAPVNTKDVNKNSWKNKQNIVYKSSIFIHIQFFIWSYCSQIVKHNLLMINAV